VGPLLLVALSNCLSIHMWINKNGVCMRPGRSFYYTLLLEPEMDSNLTYGLGLQLGLDALACLLRWWPRERTLLGIS
jgi:hypothetical protein